MLKAIGLTLGVFLSFEGYSFEIHSKHCLAGCPYGSPTTNDLIIREIYLLSSNDTTKFSDWAAYKVDYKNFGKSKKRHWKPDPLLDSSETLEPRDYKSAFKKGGYDRGHQIPLGSFSGTKYWYETNYLSNITPQKSQLNQGPWRNLEEAIRRLSKRNKQEVYVMTGVLYENPPKSQKLTVQRLPNSDEAHKIPSHYWKIISMDFRKGIKTSAFLMPQTARKKDSYCSYKVLISEIEKRAKLNFFHGLRNEERKLLNNSVGKLYSQLDCSSKTKVSH